MIKNQGQNKGTRSWAVGTSLLLHGLVFVGMGVGTLPGAVPQPAALSVFLAMPEVVTQQVPGARSPVIKTVVAEAVTTQPEQTVRPEPVEVETAPVVVGVISDKSSKPQVEPLEEQVVQVAELPAEKILTADVIIPESRPALQPDSGAGGLTDAFTKLAAGVEEVSPDHRSPITDHQSTLLAFAGDPTALGMIAQDVLGPGLFKPEVLSLPEPEYPILSRKRGEEGRVIIEIEISAKGKVLRAEIVKSSSYPRLDRAALEAVKIAVFNPASEFGIPVESELKVAYRFELRQ